MRRARPWMLAVLLLALAGTQAAEAQREPDRRTRAEAARRGWLGISYHQPEDSGDRIVVTGVVPGSPAERAGLQAGDTILRWNGRPGVAAAIAERPLSPGETVRLRVRRGGQRDRDVAVVVGERPREVVTRRRLGNGEEVIVVRPGAVVDALRLHGDSLRVHLDSLAVHADSLHHRLRIMLRDSLGPRLRELEHLRVPEFEIRMREGHHGGEPFVFDFDLGARSVAGAEFAGVSEDLSEALDVERGVLVLRVAPETPAGRAGLRAGDVVVRANGQEVRSVRELRQTVARSRQRAVELEVMRKGQRRTLQMRWE